MSGSFFQVAYAVQDRRFEDAIGLLTKLLDVVPEHSAARIYRGKLYAAIGQWDCAISDFQSELALNPSDMESRLLLASAFTILNDYETAAKHFRSVSLNLAT